MASLAFLTDLNARVQFIATERKEVIQKLAQQGRKAKAPLDGESTEFKPLFRRLDALLTWLDDDVQIGPELRDKTQIDKALLVINKEEHYFPETFKAKATALTAKWESENWGKPPRAVDSPTENGRLRSDDEGDGDENDIRSPAKRRRVSQATDASVGVIKSPDPGHPIWGRDGIMYGLALKRMESGRKSKVLDPQYKRLQRSAKVYGHNDITVGRWFPFQLCAVFHGAHGTSQAGITPGSAGAYSVIVAGVYEDLDRDDGDTIYYSGSGSHDNTDPGRIAEPTGGTRSLHSSIDSDHPVRVLRSHSGNSSWAPTKGLRYDGLYQVVSVSTPRNLKGGLYERFKLQRLEDDDQMPLLACKVRPNYADLRDYDRIEQGYPSRR